MKHSFLILGAGRQGTAAAYDLLLHGEAKALTLADADPRTAEAALKRLRSLLPHAARRTKIRACAVDARSGTDLGKVVGGHDVVLCALPYRFDLAVAEAAVSKRVSYLDLGGHLETARQVLRLDAAARRAGISVIPDCGLAPGLSTSLAVYGIEAMDICRDVRVYCGGLPQNRDLPLGYKLVFPLQGLWGIYLHEAAVLRQGKVSMIPSLGDREDVDLPEPLGRLEAFVTSGGASTAPWTFKGRLRTFEYKTLRYPGHLSQIRALLELGFLDRKSVQLNGSKVVPAELAETLLDSHLRHPREKDLVVLRVVCSGERRGRPAELLLDLLDLEDARTGFTAMERTTAFPAAGVAWMLASGLIPRRGAVPAETAVPAGELLAQVRRRGLRVRETWRVQ